MFDSCSSQFAVMAEERRDCREQEYKDKFGNCIPCRQCDAGQELSKVCQFFTRLFIFSFSLIRNIGAHIKLVFLIS